MKRRAVDAATELSDSLDFLIRSTRRLLMSRIEDRIAQDGIPLRLWFPLRVLYKNEGITQREFGQILGYGDAHAGVIVQIMHRHNLVRRRPGQIDRRRNDLYLTPAGKRMVRRTLGHMRAINNRIVAGFKENEKRTLRTLLLRAHKNLMEP